MGFVSLAWPGRAQRWMKRNSSAALSTDGMDTGELRLADIGDEAVSIIGVGLVGSGWQGRMGAYM